MNILIAACPPLEEGFSLHENVPTDAVQPVGGWIYVQGSR